MKKRCARCGMIRAVKDLVLREDSTYLCFYCWNEIKSEKNTNS